MKKQKLAHLYEYVYKVSSRGRKENVREIIILIRVYLATAVTERRRKQNKINRKEGKMKKFLREILLSMTIHTYSVELLFIFHVLLIMMMIIMNPLWGYSFDGVLNWILDFSLFCLFTFIFEV